MKSMLITNANLVNEGKVIESDVLIRGTRIEKIGVNLSAYPATQVVDAKGNFLLPGAIDDQVHFREPGLTHKGNIYSESRAAVAGGVTSFMEMPNTVPPVFTQALLEDKYQIAARTSLANYSFFMGASNDNLDEALRSDLSKICGLKIFMGSSTGNLLVDDENVLEGFYSKFPGLIATHCEDEPTIRRNTEEFKQRYGEGMSVKYHPKIRGTEACYKSSSFAVELAKKHGTRLHILHISTAKETGLFDNSIPLEKKKITAEACIHHLWFNDTDYDRLGMFIKWNPAIKTVADQQEIFRALLDDRIDVIATDHAPHTLEEKKNNYFQAPSGGPLVQHSVVAMMEFYHQRKITLEKIVQKMAHNPAILFQINERGFIREGYFADLVLVNPNRPWKVEKSNILAKCGWSPFEGNTFKSAITHTWVSGHLAFSDGKFDESKNGERLSFSR
ncbi:MAG: dihydroorotase [Cyclobacteriaceae bacterium]|nr:dihydroorotase [Cyclobacteriaceae bacterium]